MCLLERLYEEHFEEISFLYDLLGAIKKSQISWTDCEDTETRIKAHLAALMIGGEKAYEMTLKKSFSDDIGEFYGAVCLISFKKDISNLEKLIPTISDMEKAGAFYSGLSHYWDSEFKDEFFLKLINEAKKNIFLLIPMAKLNFEKELGFEKELVELSRIYKEVDPYLNMILEASYFYKSCMVAKEVLKNNGLTNHINVLKAFLISGCRENILDMIESFDIEKLPPYLAPLHEKINEAQPLKDLLSIGFLGKPEHFPFLLKSLETKETAEEASIALNLITGADLYEEIFVPEEIDIDMLFDDEIELFNKGELYKENEFPGEYIERISQNKREWEDWLDFNKNCFEPGERYRRGKKYSLQVLVNQLGELREKDFIRKLVYEELAVFFDLNIIFSIEMTISQQKKIIEKIKNKFLNIKKLPNYSWFMQEEEI